MPDHLPAPVQPSPAAAAPLNWDAELRGASFLVKSGLCPTAIKTPEAALFVILAGRDLGLSPVAALRNVTVIQGKIEVAADMQLALFHRAGGRSKWLEITATRAALQLSAPWLDAPHTSEFTAQDATRAGLTGDNWRKYPKAMLRSRAITQGLKDVGYDATAGVYAPGEIGGPEVVDVTGELLAGVTADGEILSGTVEDAPAPSILGPGDTLLPGGPSKWGGNGGKALRDVPTHALEAFGNWVLKQPDPSETLVAVAEDVRIVLDERIAAALDGPREPDDE